MNDPALSHLVGKDKDNNPKVYQLTAPYADAFPRITFFEVINEDSEFADDEAYASDISIQIDVWSKASTSAISKEVDRVMKAQGWSRTTGADLYEEDTKIFHKALRYRASFEE
ncbi:MAG: DUF3168 domain-containing protein [Candidatus Pristimantibacillus lignocellulolyticus]|uniref:DUF3168 domain-containing protein n=1 Tax=Candidatus Pristimantibacillus lignocellulolyticus TaxID=2994561 RepID=A0A9J6ZLB4_9BACL|nr:MAG: DUF3168 domain-containing protein [Candidatus Pristimantibacillus lignocellulolyticus]